MCRIEFHFHKRAGLVMERKRGLWLPMGLCLPRERPANPSFGSMAHVRDTTDLG